MAAPKPASPIVTLLTDFGTRDHYVASMKGVLLSINPAMRIVDITHEIAPQEIREAGFTLARSYPFFPPGSVHLLVVDPGVGTSRRLLAARTENHFFVGPDNGALGVVFAEEAPREVVSITASHHFRKEISSTFHGRDILAPVAARLSLGTALAHFGETVTDWVPSPIPPPRRGDQGEWMLQVAAVDRFGNVVLNLKEEAFASTRGGEGSVPFLLEIGGSSVQRLLRTYGDCQDDRPFALFNSSGYLEIAVRGGSAAALLRCRAGQDARLVG
jgi:S-adenosyl-L-methionine hydrolase (adenosine-forming)